MIKAFTTGPFTGRHITAILVSFFAVVFAVNFLMARDAISTFGGVVVENSYVASQEYNKWLGEAAREKALGWKAEAGRDADGRVTVKLTGAPAKGVTLTGDAWHPLGRLPDQPLRFTQQADGSYLSDATLPAGRWKLRIQAVAGKDKWREEQDLL
ncbi:FixH family protein [Novosphingobium sp.]|uniref:FixH family protein n=1 Tax=Novosphingobium sp. TaxID=1874826 RepID=UPI0035B28C76